jgi:hypothetical protein
MYFYIIRMVESTLISEIFVLKKIFARVKTKRFVLKFLFSITLNIDVDKSVPFAEIFVIVTSIKHIVYNHCRG